MLTANISVLMFMMIMYISFFVFIMCGFFFGGEGATSIPIQSAVKFCSWYAAVQ
jgi:hypothetical protein